MSALLVVGDVPAQRRDRIMFIVCGKALKKFLRNHTPGGFEVQDRKYSQMLEVGRIVVLLTVTTAAAVAESRVVAKPRVIQAVRANTAPKIDGQLNDTCWSQVPEITGFQIYRTRDLAATQTYGYVCY
ncbi:MAG: hypothetical protein MK179_21495, partial [Pirellulaceae bacterium]|nr:hypothetical protein [Pirellulaceae bacterium]